VLARLDKTQDPQLFTQVFRDLQTLPVELRDNSYCYSAMPQALNNNYMDRVFVEECARQDVLRSFVQLQSAKQLAALPDGSNRKQRVQQYFDELDKEVNVHICWLLVWVGTLNYQHDSEKAFRLKQAIEVLRKVNAKSGGKLNVRPRLNL